MTAAALICPELASPLGAAGYTDAASALLAPDPDADEPMDELRSPDADLEGTGADSVPPRSDAEHDTLEGALLALLRGETQACLVCGEPVAGEAERVECPACGSVLEAAPTEVIPGQMSLME
jgi:hypothetical protein